MNGPQPNSYASNYYRSLAIPYFCLPSDVKSSEKFNKWLTDTRFVNNLNRYTNLRVSSFEWTGLPETIDPVIVEMLLMTYGTIGMHRDKDGNFLCLGLVPMGKDGLSVNGRPYNGYLYGFNGKMFECKLYQEGITEPIIRETATHNYVTADYDTVMGQENYIGYSFFNQLLVKIYDLTNREKILNQNIQASAQPLIITCQESEKESIKQELKLIEDGQPRIIAFNGAFANDKIEVLQTNFKPETINILAQELERINDEIRVMLGINSNGAMANKRERLLVDEVNSNNTQIQVEVEQALVFRKRFCEQCNEAFGLNIDCEFRYATPEIEPYQSDSPQEMEYGLDNNEKEGSSYGNN